MLTEKDYCDYDTCVALRELGYMGICDAYYDLTGNYSYNHDSFEILYTRDFIHPDDKDRVAAPLLYQPQKWLRKEKEIEVNASWDNEKSYWFWYISKMADIDYSNNIVSESIYNTYEEALSEGIKEASKHIEII